jgi:hypothetical protein
MLHRMSNLLKPRSRFDALACAVLNAIRIKSFSIYVSSSTRFVLSLVILWNPKCSSFLKAPYQYNQTNCTPTAYRLHSPRKKETIYVSTDKAHSTLSLGSCRKPDRCIGFARPVLQLVAKSGYSDTYLEFLYEFVNTSIAIES